MLDIKLFDAPRVSFVVFASAKSGTTWMQRMLSAHPQVHCTESRLFGRHFNPKHPITPHLTMQQFVEFLSRYYNPPCDKEDRGKFFGTALHNVIDALAETTALASGKPVIGEKFTPYPGTAHDALESLHGYNPDLRLIHLVRDGRDVVVSGAAQKGNLFGTSNTQGVSDDDLGFFMELWRESAEAGIEAVGRFANSITVRYEDLLESGPDEMARVFGLIGVDSDSGVVKSCLESASFERLSGGRHRGQEDPSSFFRHGVAGDWRRKFSHEQAAAFDERCGVLLDQLGYERSSRDSMYAA